MNQKDTTAGYVDLSNKTYALFVEAYASANRRALEYAKSAWDILARPYNSTAVETTVRENFDRANQLVTLTVTELSATAQQSAELAQKLAENGAAWQETAAHGFRGVVDTGLSNIAYVKETASQQLDEFAKRVDQVNSRAAAQVSQN